MATVEKIQDPMPTGNIGYGTTALSLAFTFLSDLGNGTQPYENAAGTQHEGLSGGERDNSGCLSDFNSASLWLFHYANLTIFHVTPPSIHQ